MVAGSTGLNAFIGSLDNVFLRGITPSSIHGTIPEILFCLYQMTFCCITPALMVGAFVERMKYSSVMWFVALWTTVVYFPFVHMVWAGPGGFLTDLGVLDFAGGIVVHVTAGVSALVASIVCGPRKNNKLIAGDLPMAIIGTGILIFGWCVLLH